MIARPDWARFNARTHPGWAVNVAKGLHPLGRALRANGKGRCGTCEFRLRGRCATFPEDVHGAFIRVGWMACEAYVPHPRARYTKAEQAAMRAEGANP